VNAAAHERPGDGSGRGEATAGLWTIPNLISMARLAGVPLFLWLVLGPHADWWALAVLVVAGLSDWLDGKIARWLDQVSRYGRLLDPAADRLYILATLIALTLRDIIPWWLMAVLLAREAFILAFQVVVQHYGYRWLPVSFLGKAATLCLMYAFPFLFISDHSGALAVLTRVFGWAFAIWGTALYWWAGIVYAVQACGLVIADRRARRGTVHDIAPDAAVGRRRVVGGAASDAAHPGPTHDDPDEGTKRGHGDEEPAET